jgi:hypothetical protein
MPEDVAAARELLSHVPRHPRMHLLIPAGQDDLQRAALVIEQQLAASNIELELEALENTEMLDRLMRRDFDMMIFFASLEPRYFRRFLGSPPGNISAYQASDFIDAVAHDKPDVARAALLRDLPATPLFRMREAVVVNRRFCNVKPVVLFDLNWLADVRLCAPGEVE